MAVHFNAYLRSEEVPATHYVSSEASFAYAAISIAVGTIALMILIRAGTIAMSDWFQFR